MPLQPRIVDAEPAGAFLIRLRFTDGAEATLDLAPWVAGRGGVFAPLQDEGYFAQIAVDHDAGTICWPNGADLDPDLLYQAAMSTP
jgi:hypothetical protein